MSFQANGEEEFGLRGILLILQFKMVRDIKNYFNSCFKVVQFCKNKNSLGIYCLSF